MGIERLSQIWPEWKIAGELGQGAFGTVYKAVNEEAGFSVYSAIKVLSIPSSKAELDALQSEGMSISDSKEYFKEIVDDFLNEIKVMNALKGAPNIVGVEQFKIVEKADSVGWDIFIRMELLKSFKEYLIEHTPTEDEIIKLGTDICAALEVCANMNIIHRDIKPANIFIDNFGNFKLGDFGIAKELEKTSGAVSVKGTFNFMAPEVVKGDRYDSTVDIYSLGLVLYSLCNNNCPPFVDAVNAGYSKRKEAIDRRMNGDILSPPANASTELANVILTACAYQPSKRFHTPTAFKNALAICKSGSSITPSYTFTPNIPVQNTAKPDIDKTISVRKIHRQDYAATAPIPQLKDSFSSNTNTAQNASRSDIDGLVKRIFVFLENKNWDSAEEYCERVLNIDPECSKAYLGKFMVSLFIASVGDIAGRGINVSRFNDYEKALFYAKGEEKEILLTIKEESEANYYASATERIAREQKAQKEREECARAAEERERKAEEERLAREKQLEEERLAREKQLEEERLARERAEEEERKKREEIRNRYLNIRRRIEPSL